MKKIIERQYLSIPAVRGVCVENDLYTRGTNEEYAAMFDMVRPLDGKQGAITAEDLYPIATNILAHSDTEMSLTILLYCLGRRIDRCYEEVEEHGQFVVTIEGTEDGPEYMIYTDGQKHRERETIMARFETYGAAVAYKRNILACY